MKFLLLILLTVFQMQSAQASIMVALEEMWQYSPINYASCSIRTQSNSEISIQCRHDSSFEIKLENIAINKELITDIKESNEPIWYSQNSFNPQMYTSKYISIQKDMDKNVLLEEPTTISIIF